LPADPTPEKTCLRASASQPASQPASQLELTCKLTSYLKTPAKKTVLDRSRNVVFLEGKVLTLQQKISDFALRVAFVKQFKFSAKFIATLQLAKCCQSS
jgi:hypothetical protein